ncbi:hypothetical protein [Elizabethkingia anophelis]
MRNHKDQKNAPEEPNLCKNRYDRKQVFRWKYYLTAVTHPLYLPGIYI